MTQDFAGKAALVTGSTSGTGKAAAHQPAGRGTHMIPGGRCTNIHRRSKGVWSQWARPRS